MSSVTICLHLSEVESMVSIVVYNVWISRNGLRFTLPKMAPINSALGFPVFFILRYLIIKVRSTISLTLSVCSLFKYGNIPWTTSLIKFFFIVFSPLFAETFTSGSSLFNSRHCWVYMPLKPLKITSSSDSISFLPLSHKTSIFLVHNVISIIYTLSSFLNIWLSFVFFIFYFLFLYLVIIYCNIFDKDVIIISFSLFKDSISFNENSLVSLFSQQLL